MDLFSVRKQHFKLPNAELTYIPNFISESKATAIFNHLQQQTPWQHDDITVFGKTYKQPRLTALYGDSNATYSYANITMAPLPFTKQLLDLKTRVEKASNTTFNSVLLNLYRHGNDSNGWHADNEKELGQNPTIASLSFGQVRPFHFKHRHIKQERYKLPLHHGSLLLMAGEMQQYWLHQIAKTKQQIMPRINLTFRRLV